MTIFDEYANDEHRDEQRRNEQIELAEKTVGESVKKLIDDKDVPNVGGGDHYALEICLDCGQLQGEWPVETPESLAAEATKEP